MSENPPAWFKKQETTTSDSADLKSRKAALVAELPALTDKQRGKGRANSFQPYLLIRSVLGDRGDRPINVPFWESPDIWTIAGDPSAAPAIPATHGGIAVAGQPNTVYAHVWNLGFAPLAGVHVEFYWFNPSLGITGPTGHSIGVARCELAGRGMQGSHQLVKCPVAWVPIVENGGHECLVARAWGIGDPLGANEWNPWQNRHTAQRNVSVVSAGTGVNKLIHSLNLTRLAGARVQLVQVGLNEATLARHIVGASQTVDPVQTHVLGEIDAQDLVTLAQPGVVQTATLAPVHTLAAEGAPTPPTVHAVGTVSLVNTPALLNLQATPVKSTPTPLLSPIASKTPIVVPTNTTVPPPAATTASLTDLLNSVITLHGDTTTKLLSPVANQTQVLRLATYSGTQLVGGYTLVVSGAS